MSGATATTLDSTEGTVYVVDTSGTGITTSQERVVESEIEPIS